MSSRACKPVHATAVRARRGFASRLVAVTALLVGALSACTESPLPPLPDSARDEVGVYAAVLRHVISQARGHPVTLVVDDQAWSSGESPDGEAVPREPRMTSEQMDAALRGFVMLRRSCVEDFARRPAARASVGPLPQSDRIHRLRPMSDEERRAYYWDGFHEEYGNDAVEITMSPVGFDESGTQAFLSVSFYKDFLYGHSDYVVVERERTGWRVVASALYSQS